MSVMMQHFDLDVCLKEKCRRFKHHNNATPQVRQLSGSYHQNYTSRHCNSEWPYKVDKLQLVSTALVHRTKAAVLAAHSAAFKSSLQYYGATVWNQPDKSIYRLSNGIWHKYTWWTDCNNCLLCLSVSFITQDSVKQHWNWLDFPGEINSIQIIIALLYKNFWWTCTI